MKHIECSQLIPLASPLETSTIKYSLVERLRASFHVETVGEGTENFDVNMMGKDSPCRCKLSIILKTDASRARVIVSGVATISPYTKIMYALGILALLVLGLFPGTINTSGQGSGATDFLVFLFLGAYVLFDMNKKIAELENLLERVLKALSTEFSA